MASPQKNLPIEWDIAEKERFKEMMQETKKRSVFLSQRIKAEIRQKLSLIEENPEIFEADSLKTDNDGTFRKFTVTHIRFVY